MQPKEQARDHDGDASQPQRWYIHHNLRFIWDILYSGSLNHVSTLRIIMFTVHQQNERQQIMMARFVTATDWIPPPTPVWYVFCLRAVHNSLIYINWSDHSGVFGLLAHVPGQLLLQVIEVFALPLHCHPGQLSSPQVVPQCIGRLHLFAFCQSRLRNKDSVPVLRLEHLRC